jgi:hypothetical protein
MLKVLPENVRLQILADSVQGQTATVSEPLASSFLLWRSFSPKTSTYFFPFPVFIFAFLILIKDDHRNLAALHAEGIDFGKF